MPNSTIILVLLTVAAAGFGLLRLPGVAALDDASQQRQILTRDELSSLLDIVRAGDDRIMRWNVQDPTRLAIEQGACDAFPEALDFLLEPRSPDDGKDAESLAGIACEYATFCITDNPSNRALFGQNEGLFQRVVQLINSPDNYTSAMASHLVYISVFDNPRNHKLFYKAGVLAAITRVILADAATANDDDETSRKPQAVMWAAAALQNMAASYCNGRCPWEWLGHAQHIAVAPDDLPVTSPGDSMRLATRWQPNGPALLEKLKELVCEGPVTQSLGPGAGTGIINRDENSRSIIAWAAADALKNLVLEPIMKELVDTPDTMACICRMIHSSDWLEANKAQGIVRHVRSQQMPCHYRDEDHNGDLICVDKHFVDEEGYSCDWYNSEEATEEDCSMTDTFNEELTAKDACCGCGGGFRLVSDVANDDEKAEAAAAL